MKRRKCELDPAGLCGTSIDTGDVVFGDNEPNLVYIDKVFSFNSDTSCPVVFNLDTRCDTEDFEVKFTTADRGCGCGCNPAELDCNAVFEIERAFAVLHFIETSPPGNISPSQVTIDGEEVDSVEFQNGRYLVGISELASRLQHRRCLDANLPSKNFLLIRDVCTWEIRATYVLEGTVTTGGRTCCFRAEISNEDDGPPTVLPTNCCSSFAIPNFSIPCTQNGIAADVAFHFSGQVKLVNPELKVKCNNRPCPSGFTLEAPGISAEFIPGRNEPTLVFKSKVVLEPKVHVECVRRTLFSINAQEGLLPCESVAGELASERRNTTDPCNNLAGVGFHHANTCTLSSNFGCRRSERVEDVCTSDRNPCRIRDDVCGRNRDDFLEDFCEELCEELRDEIFDEVRGRSCIDFEERHCDDCMGCRGNCFDNQVAGCRDDRFRGCNRDRSVAAARNACQFFGSNGCSW